MKALALNHDTRRLSIAYLLSKVGEFAFEAAFAVCLVRLTNADILLIGVAYFLRYIPTVFFSPLGGWLADEFSKKNTLVVSELLKAGAALAIFTVSALVENSLITIIFLSMLMTAGDCIHTPTFRAYFPNIVERKELSSLNSGLQAIEDCASIIGPLIFSLASILFSPNITFLAFFFLLSTSALLTTTLRPATPRNENTCKPSPFLKEAVLNILLIKKLNKPLFTIICCTTLCATFATSILKFILPAAVLEEFKFEASVGYVYSLLAFGTVIGSILYEKFNISTSARSVVRYWWVYGSLLLISALALELNTALFITSLFFVGFSGAFVDISIVTNIQLLSKTHEVGRNFSLYYFTAVLGDALSGLIASAVFLIAGSSTFIGMALLLTAAPLSWGLRKEEDEKDDHI